MAYRMWSEEKTKAMVEYLSSLLNCDAQEIPVEALVHRFILKSSGLSPFAHCVNHFIGPVLGRRQPLLSSVAHMDYGDDFTDCPALRLVPFWRLSEFLRRRWKRTDSGRELDRRKKKKSIFHEYLDHVRDDISRDAVYGACDEKIWRLSSSGDSNHAADESQLNGEGEGEREREFMRNVCRRRSASDGLNQCRDIERVFWKFFRLTQYMDRVDAQIGRCRRKLRLLVAAKTLIVAEVHRTSFADLEPLIRRMPEVQIVFYVRDPRAIAVSRSDPNTRQTFVMTSGWKAVNESLLLCRRMTDDVEAKKVLERRYPGSIWTLRYEDFVLEPDARVADLYRWLRRKVPQDLGRWINETMRAADGDDGIYGIHRTDGQQRIGKWRAKVTYEEGAAMTKHCIGVLNELKYDL